MIQTIPNDLLQLLLSNKQVRIETTSKDILLFFHFYFPHYIQYKTADFQKEILKILQDINNSFVALVAFRGSAKSTFCSLLLPIWSSVGFHKKRHIVIVCQNQQRAQQLLAIIKNELETNERLIADFGPFINSNEQWNLNTLALSNGTRITAVSIEERIRGMRHGQYRPDLIIGDDIEDVQSARVQESRDKLWQFINAELIPAGDKNTRYIFIGNLVHMDSAMMKLKKTILAGKIQGAIYREYPLLGGNNQRKIAWPGKYKTMDEINKLKQTVLSEIDYLREYLLLIVPEGNQIIFPDDIHRYKERELECRNDFRSLVVSIDPAVSEKQNRDNTSIIVASLYGYDKKLDTFIHPHPINRQITVPEIISEVKRIIASFPPRADYVILVEAVSFQLALVQILQTEGINAIAVGIDGQDKRARLTTNRQFIRTHVFFPEYGTEDLEKQAFGLGVERYDDLVDALTLLCKYVVDLRLKPSSNPVIINCDFYKNSRVRISSESKEEFDCDKFFGNKRKHHWRRVV